MQSGPTPTTTHGSLTRPFAAHLPMPQSPSAREIFTPSALNRLVRDLLQDALPSIWIEGELSNVARPASGHIYFTLKDARAQVRCALFKPKSTWLKFKPADGMHVLARARVGLYEPRGEYQLIVEHLEEAGEGALRREFERLKNQLETEGLFDAARKRPIPVLPRRIGVITSATGAAIRDVLSVLERRLPMIDVDVLPVPVQGREAPPAIVEMLRKASASGRYDVLLLTRGGGSLEDLWAFNDEAVARAVHDSAVPVVSAIGHEIDFSISDFVADLRAPTPSAAAELLVPDARSLQQTLQQMAQRLHTHLERRLHTQTQHLDHLQARLQSRRPQTRLAQGRERLRALHARLQRAAGTHMQRRQAHLRQQLTALHAHHPRQRLAAADLALANTYRQLRSATWAALEQRRQALQQTGRTLHAVSPLATLERGYAILRDEHGQLLRSAAAVAPHARLSARLADGTLQLQNVTPEKKAG